MQALTCLVMLWIFLTHTEVEIVYEHQQVHFSDLVSSCSLHLFFSFVLLKESQPSPVSHSYLALCLCLVRTSGLLLTALGTETQVLIMWLILVPTPDDLVSQPKQGGPQGLRVSLCDLKFQNDLITF